MRKTDALANPLASPEIESENQTLLTTSQKSGPGQGVGGGAPKGNRNAVKHGLYSPVSAPRQRQRRLRQRVRALRRKYPHLESAPDHLVQRYCELDTIAAKCFLLLADDDVLTEDGEPKRLLTEYRRLTEALGRLAERLGIVQKLAAEPDPISTLFGKEARRA